MRKNPNNTTYIHFTDEQKQRANTVDLEDFLRCKGEKLIKCGRDKRLASDKSITIRGNTWYDHSKSVEKGGLAIDFVQAFYGLTFPEAVVELIGERGNQLTPRYQSYVKKEEPPKLFTLPPKNNDMKRTFAYLTKHRCIDYSVLSFFAQKGLIYESNEPSKDGQTTYHNTVFVGCDENGVARHGHKKSTYSQGATFMQNIEGSKPKHSFHYLGGSNRLYVFESPIDLLSFITLNKNSDWKKYNYVALCGVSPQPILQLLDSNNSLTHVVLCMDNDKAGHSATRQFEELLAEREITSSQVIPDGKDFNEDLQASQMESIEQQPMMAMG